MKLAKLTILIILSANFLIAQSEKKNFDWNGYGQFRIYKISDVSEGFMVRRAKLWVIGNVTTAEEFSYKVMGIFSYNHAGYFGLLDFYGNYSFNKNYIRFGQQIPEFSLQRLQADWEIPVVEVAKDGHILAFVDIGKNHCATCYAYGLQVILGTTFGKGNIKRTHKGKWALTLVDKASGKAVRVTPTAEAMLGNKKTTFFTDYSEKGIPASLVTNEVVEPLVQKVIGAPEEMLMNISDVFDYKVEPPKDSFASFVCEECGEMTVEEYGRVKGDKKVCIDCAAK